MIVLAIIALLSVVRLRLACESPTSILSEAFAQSLLLAAVWYWSLAYRLADRTAVRSRPATTRQPSVVRIFAIVGGLVVLPWINEVVLRLMGQGTGLELLMMSSFGWATLGAAWLVYRRRALSTTVICSGFLTLLSTCSSDSSVALIFAYVWGALCLWWLASNHWQRMANCQAQAVVENGWHRPLTVIAGCLIFFIAAWSVAGRLPEAQRLGWEVMPTSGGTTGNDPHATGGVGNGDAVVAAREHAATFGAVDSDLFLDSEEASLYDMFSDTFGEPVRKQTVERSIALAPEEQEPQQPEKMAQSDESSSKLTTQRHGKAQTQTAENKITDAVLFWIGRSNMHLPLRRYAHFDGIEWSEEAAGSDRFSSDALSYVSPSDQALLAQTEKERVWFSSQAASYQAQVVPGLYLGARPEAIKYARLKTRAIPAVAGFYSWHVDQINDASMFRLDQHDNLTMPGRLRVPEYTVVRFVNRELEVEQIEAASVTTVPDSLATPDSLAVSDSSDVAGTLATARSDREVILQRLLAQWLGKYAKQDVSSWLVCQQIADQLRTGYQLDRSVDYADCPDPVAAFLQRGAGSDLMFATAAAVMLQKVGLKSRLVTGFIARGENRLGWTQEMAVYPGDMHAWVEVCLQGCWIPLEPSPGYPQPLVHQSWRHWLKQQAWTIATGTLIALSAGGSLWWQRAFWFDCLCKLCGGVLRLVSDRLRCRWLLRVLDLRCWLVGRPRPAHVPPRRWYGQLLHDAPENIRSALDVLFREADRLWFGQAAQLSDAGRHACRTLWYQTTCKRLQSTGQATK